MTGTGDTALYSLSTASTVFTVFEIGVSDFFTGVSIGFRISGLGFGDSGVSFFASSTTLNGSGSPGKGYFPSGYVHSSGFSSGATIGSMSGGIVSTTGAGSGSPSDWIYSVDTHHWTFPFPPASVSAASASTRTKICESSGP